MSIILVSDNPLFTEAISETLSNRLGPDLAFAPPEQALERIKEEHPEVILIDEDLPPGMLRKILRQSQRLRKTRLILLNCNANDFIVLDSYQSTISNVEDLVRYIQMGKVGNGSQS